MNTVADPIPQVDQVDALIKSIRIPPRPSLLADMQRELASEDPSPEAIGKIVASDVGMCDGDVRERGGTSGVV